jgi:hypothetical protein
VIRARKDKTRKMESICKQPTMCVSLSWSELKRMGRTGRTTDELLLVGSRRSRKDQLSCRDLVRTHQGYQCRAHFPRRNRPHLELCRYGQPPPTRGPGRLTGALHRDSRRAQATRTERANVASISGGCLAGVACSAGTVSTAGIAGAPTGSEARSGTRLGSSASYPARKTRR